MTRRLFLKGLGLVSLAAFAVLGALGLARKKEAVQSAPIDHERASFILTAKEIERKFAQIVPPYFISDDPERDRKAIHDRSWEICREYQTRGLVRFIGGSAPSYIPLRGVVEGSFTVGSRDGKTSAVVSWQYTPNQPENRNRFKRVIEVNDCEVIRRAFEALPKGLPQDQRVVSGPLGLIETITIE
jgi:hypothetical protein